MSDIDEIEYSGSSKQESGSYHFSTEPPGTPPTITNDAAERRHRRSVSEQLFSVPTFSNFSSRAFHRGRHRKRTAVGKSEEEGDREEDVASFGEGTGGGSLGGFQTGWEYGGRSGLATYYSDFSPFDRNLDATNQQQSSAGRQGGGAHFKQALKRTVKKALTTSKQEDEGNAESSLNESSMLARDSRRRYKKASEDRKRHTRLTAYGAEHHDVKSKSDDEIPCDVPTILESDTDEQLPDHQRKQNRIRVSLADLFLKMKRSISMHSLDEEYRQIFWNCTLFLRSAKLKERINCCVHIFYMDKFIAKSGFSGETSNPKWNETFTFNLSQIDEMLQLQVIEKHTLRSDKLIGRAYVALNRGESVYTHEAPIRYFSVRKGDTRVLGTLSLDTSVESSLITSLDGSSLFGSLDEQERLSEEISAKTTTSTSKKSSLRRNLVRRFASHVHRHRFHRSKQRNQIQSSKETLCEHYIGHEGTFYFSPYEITRRFLETESAAPPPSVTWRPFFDWPGNRSLYLPMVPIQRRYPVRFWELRIPKLAWPIEFLLPMTRLAFPTANLVDSLDVKDTVKLTKIVESGLVNIFLVGARGLRSIPQVDMISGCGLDEKGGGGGNAMGNSFNGGDAATESLGAGGAALMGTSPETRAASLVALHWAAKSLTVSPSPQVVLSYGPEKRASSVVKNNSNPDFLEEFEFKLTNGAPRFIKIIVYDRETQTGTGGIPRNSILGETVIDLADMPIELTQKMEVQLLKNSNEARLLMFVTITGLNTAIRSPVQTPPSMISSPRSVISGNGSPTERDEKPSYPSLPMNYLQLVAEHFSLKNSLRNPHDVGWLRVKICSAMGLGGKTINGRIECFCVIDLFNTRLKTQSVIKQKNSTWNRCFVIPLMDIHGIMKITVIETEKSKMEVIGGLAIHPLRVDNGGSKWYALKTPDLRSPTKGSILLEINVYFNQFKSALKTFTPKETPYRSLAIKQKDRHMHNLRLLQQRFEHVKPLLELIRWCGRVLDDWWLWKNPLHSILGLIGYQLLIYYFKPFFIPLYMVLVLLKNRIYNRGGVDSIIYGLKYNKTAAKLASPQEHEIYKRQYEMIEQYMVQGAYSRSQSWSPRENGNEGDDLDLFEQSSLTLDDDAVKKFSSAAKNKDDSDAPNLYNLTLPELSSDQSSEEDEREAIPNKVRWELAIIKKPNFSTTNSNNNNFF
uniref:C2 domain-containing protein n=1 Tax=Mesocestoides corti TaxID=53468 RepID=A0A5K3EP47_MESCO